MLLVNIKVNCIFLISGNVYFEYIDDLNYSKDYLKAMGNKIMVLPDEFDNMYERNVTSIKGKYFFPEEKFLEEWGKYKAAKGL